MTEFIVVIAFLLFMVALVFKPWKFSMGDEKKRAWISYTMLVWLVALLVTGFIANAMGLTGFSDQLQVAGVVLGFLFVPIAILAVIELRDRS